MKDIHTHRINHDKLKAYVTNAVTEISKTETEARVPLSSDICVEDARDWVNNGSRL
jgi:hypothetical protein